MHPSNFAQTGFVEAPDPAELAAVAHRHGAIVVDDLGSGALLDTAQFGLAHEPMPRERLEAGADLVTFSGDKLVGGPQAGIIAGRADLVEKLRRDPLARAMRPDKVLLAALAATLRLYRGGAAVTEIPIWRQIATPVDELEQRSMELLASITAEGLLAAPDSRVWVTLAADRTESTIGGGSLPGQTLPSWAIVVTRRATAAPARGAPSGRPPSSVGSSTTRSCSTCERSSPATTRASRRPSARRSSHCRAELRADPRHRHRRAHRPRQDEPAARADRDRCRPAARGAGARA